MSTPAATPRLIAARELFADGDAAHVLFGHVRGEAGVFATGAFFALRQLARRLPELAGLAADEVDLLLGLVEETTPTAGPTPSSHALHDAATCLGPPLHASTRAPSSFLSAAPWPAVPATCWSSPSSA